MPAPSTMRRYFSNTFTQTTRLAMPVSSSRVMNMVAGQPYPTTMDVECSRSRRKIYPVGTKFRIYA
ncbi:hypothetical protein F4V91_31945 [Neorhizobium galegae]|uniref:Uncharacterized protein n=1 Tax=Neorhizobium galegae TaxID=399 RepID=A0A6A1TIY7_NEOGA|nr:hypothetical protein F4V91_31945 [Neorhizobium galegae]